MTTPPVSNQTFRVVGVLEVVGNESVSSDTFSSQGLIRMVSPSGGILGSIRGIADPTYRGMLVDTTGMPAGFNVRTRPSQGPTSIGGSNDLYALSCVSNQLTAQKVNLVTTATYQGASTEDGTPILTIERYGTANATGTLFTPITTTLQKTYKEGEDIVSTIGTSATGKSIVGSIGYTIYANTTSDRLWLGFTNRNNNYATPVKCIKMSVTGNVEIPVRLDVGTINATTYLNLPAVPPSQLLPITLDKTNNRVGINQTGPTHDLDVDGTTSTNQLLLQSIANINKPDLLMYDTTTKAVTYAPVSSITPSLAPLTLDQTNNRVGINQTTPTHDLDVNGTVATNSLLLQTIPQTSTPNILMYDTSTKAVSYALASSLAPNLLPITLDKTNNRVGINQTTPTHDLDVTGTINAQTYLLSGLPTIVYPTGGGMSVGKTIGAAGANTISMGTAAGQTTQGSEAIAIGVQAGNNAQKSGAVSMGYYAGNVTQGLAAVAIGSSAGRTNQGGYSIAIGGNCGRTNQAAFNVAIGHECGMDTQAQHAVAIGATAGTITQGTGSVAVGWGAGKTAQGAYAVAVGPRSGTTSQHAGTICLNAANADLNTTQTNSLYINPIRNTTTTPTNVLTYNTTTKEVTYGPIGSNSVLKTVNAVAYSNPAFNGLTTILSVTPGITGYVRIIATAKATKNSSTAVPNIGIYLNSSVIGSTVMTGSVGSTLYWSLGPYDILITSTDTIQFCLNYGSGTTVPANTISISTGEAVLTYQVI